MKTSIHIGENNITIGRYVRYAMSAYMLKWWWAYAVPLLMCIGLSVININFLFVAIVLLFLVFTMILFIVVIYYGLVAESRYSILSKEIDFCNEGIFLRLKKPIMNAREDDEKECCQEAGNEIAEEKIPWDKIEVMKAKDECLLLMFKSPKFSFLAIPYTAFDNEELLRETVLFIGSKIG